MTHPKAKPRNMALRCQVPDCPYVVDDTVSEAVAIAYLHNHTITHTIQLQPQVPPPNTNVTSHGPKLDRPKVDVGVNLEEWNVFTRRWDAYVRGSGLNAATCSSQLFQCAEKALGDSILKMIPDIVSRPTQDLMDVMKSLAGSHRCRSWRDQS